MPGHRGGGDEVRSSAITTAADARMRDGADRDPPRAPRCVAPQPGDFTGAMASPSRRRLMTCQPANSSPSLSSHPANGDGGRCPATAVGPGDPQSRHHHDTRCPDADGGEGKSVAARRPETPFHQTTSHHEAPPRGPAHRKETPNDHPRSDHAGSDHATRQGITTPGTRTTRRTRSAATSAVCPPVCRPRRWSCPTVTSTTCGWRR